MNDIEKVKKNVIDAADLKEPEKVPVGIDITGFAFYYAGTTYADVVDDPKACCDAFCKIFDVLPLDVTISNSIVTTTYKVYDVVGSKQYVLASDRTTVVHNQSEQHFMGNEIYDLIIEDADKYMNYTYPKQRYPFLSLPKEQAYEVFKKAALEIKKVDDANGLILERLNAKGIYGLYDEGLLCYFSPFDYFFDYYRGIKDSLVDLRRLPGKVIDACDAIWEMQKPTRDWQYEASDITDPLPMGNFVYHSATFLSDKMFERLIFHYLRDGYDKAMNAGKKMHLYGQGGFKRTVERFRDLPKGTMTLKLDEDDPFEIKEMVGDWATVCGGVPVVLLQFGTEEEVRDYVRKSFDALAPGGGYMFFPSRVLCGSKDAKIENVVAAFDEADKLSRK